MDAKQFDLFQRTLQFAVDEEKHAIETGETSHFNMKTWLRISNDDYARTPAMIMYGGEQYEVERIEGVTVGSCGTAACLAGTAVLLHGSAVPVVDSGEKVSQISGLLTEDGEFASVFSYAAKILGLTLGEAGDLFYMTDAPTEQIVECASEIAERYGHELEVIM